MTAPMTDAEIREALARAERATSGPWMTFKVVSVSGWLNGCGVDTPNGELLYRNCDAPDPNHEFIAHARTDVPRLAADLLAARAERDEARDAALQAQLLVASYSRLQSAVVSGDREAVRTRMDELSHAQAHYGLKDPSPMEELLARAETAEARCLELEGFVRGFLHASSGTRDENAAALLSRLETRAQVLLSPPSPHTCQLHRATSGASDCGLSPCEEAQVHRDRGAARPKMRCAICGLVEHVGRCASSPPPSPEATPFEADTMTHEEAKCATCGGRGTVCAVPDGYHHGCANPAHAKPCPDCHGCGGGA